MRLLKDKIEEKDRMVAEKDRMVTEKDRVITKMDEVVAEKDRMVAEKDKRIAEKDEAIKRLEESADIATAQEELRLVGNGVSELSASEPFMFKPFKDPSPVRRPGNV